jgi:hypothetical protein
MYDEENQPGWAVAEVEWEKVIAKADRAEKTEEEEEQWRVLGAGY